MDKQVGYLDFMEAEAEAAQVMLVMNLQMDQMVEMVELESLILSLGQVLLMLVVEVVVRGMM
jgi:hypothetical protein